jgi:hypothetical protein
MEQAGTHERLWDVRNTSGGGVASGVYLVRIHARSAEGEQAQVWERCAVVK